MKITAKGRYAIYILYKLETDTGEDPVSVKEIATRCGISVKYTEQIIAVLNKAGYVISSRGHQGGYRPAKSAGECVIGDILRLTEGSLSPVDCLNAGEDVCPKQGECETLILWKKVDRAIRDVVDSVTIADLIEWNRAGYQGQI